MDQTARLNRQENPVVLLNVEIYADPRIFLAIETLEVDSRLIDAGFGVGQSFFRYAAVVYEKLNAAALARENTGLLQSLQQHAEIEFSLCGKIQIVREPCVLEVRFAEAVTALQDQQRTK